MSDREKIIKGMKTCISQYECSPDNCPYYINESGLCWDRLMTDALALLKEQEIGHWIFLTDCSNGGVYCSECNTKVFNSYPFKKKLSYFCPHCGTRMEGEIERQ